MSNDEPSGFARSRAKRLKSLDEFEPPEFVGRMARVARRRQLEWWAMLATAFALGGMIGWALT